MRERKSDRAVEAGYDEAAGDRGAVVVALAVASVSGFLMGLVIHGEFATAAAIAAASPAIGFAGWWLRGAIRPGGIQAER